MDRGVGQRRVQGLSRHLGGYCVLCKDLEPVSHSPVTHSFIHSFIQAISIAPLQVHCYSEALPTQDTLLEFHAEAPQATASEGLAQGPYVAVGAGSFGREASNLPISHHVPPSLRVIDFLSLDRV